MSTNIRLMPVVQLDMEILTNEDWIDGLAYIDPSSNPIDLTGISFDMEMRMVASDATVVLKASTAANLIRVSGNTWQFLIPADTMILIPPASYVFDMLGVGDGLTRNLVQGTVTVAQGVTRE